MAPDDVTRRVLADYEGARMITMCAWCRRLDIDDEWPLAPRAALLAIDGQHTLTHTICPSCAGQLIPRAA